MLGCFTKVTQKLLICAFKMVTVTKIEIILLLQFIWINLINLINIDFLHDDFKLIFELKEGIRE